MVLLDKTNSRLGAIFRLVKKAEELAVIYRVPAGVVYVHESFVFNLAGDFVEARESIARRRRLRTKLFFFWQTQRADAGENFHPRQEEPARGRDPAQNFASGDKVDREIGGD